MIVWCADKGHSVSNLSISKVVDFLLWLWEVKTASVGHITVEKKRL